MGRNRDRPVTPGEVRQGATSRVVGQESRLESGSGKLWRGTCVLKSVRYVANVKL